MKKFTLITAFILLLSIILYADETYSTNKKGNSLYNNKQYKESLQQYDDAILLSPSDSRLKMNKGSAHYQLGEYDKAEETYTAALSSDNKEQLADAHYNMGNILFKQGAQLYQSGQQEAQEKFKSALEHYIQSLDIRPDDNDAKWNLQLTHQVLKQLEQQQKQDDKNKDNKDNKDDKNKKQDSKDQNKDNKQKEDQNQEDQKQQENKQDDEKSEEQKQQQESKQDQQEKEDQKQSEMKEQKEEDLKKEEAMRILEMFADDADTLNKPMKSKSARIKQPQQDW